MNISWSWIFTKNAIWYTTINWNCIALQIAYWYDIKWYKDTPYPVLIVSVRYMFKCLKQPSMDWCHNIPITDDSQYWQLLLVQRHPVRTEGVDCGLSDYHLLNNKAMTPDICPGWWIVNYSLGSWRLVFSHFWLILVFHYRNLLSTSTLI